MVISFITSTNWLLGETILVLGETMWAKLAIFAKSVSLIETPTYLVLFSFESAAEW